MLALFLFLLIALIVIYVISPKTKTHLWLSAVLVPLSMVILYSLISGISNSTNISSAYVAGSAMTTTLLPAIIVGFVIYFQLKKKLANEGKVKFPVFLVIVMGIALVVGIIMVVVEHKTESYMRNLLENFTSESEWSNTEDDSSVVNENILNFKGLTFSYPENWKIEQEVLQDNLAFQVSCEKTGGASDIITVVWLCGNNFGTTAEMVENTIAGIQEEMLKYNAKINSSNLYSTTFKEESASVADYNLTLFDEKTYGRCFSFVMNGNTVVITKQSNSKEKLDTEFQTIENSFNIEIPE